MMAALQASEKRRRSFRGSRLSVALFYFWLLHGAHRWDTQDIDKVTGCLPPPVVVKGDPASCKTLAARNLN